MTKEQTLRFQIKSKDFKQKNGIWGAIEETTVSFLLFIGLSLPLVYSLLPDVSKSLVIVTGFISCLIFVGITRSKKPLWGYIIILIWLLLFVFILKTDMTNGFRLTLNHISELLGRRFGRIYPLYAITIVKNGYRLSTGLFAIPPAVLIGLLSVYISKGRYMLLSGLIMTGLIFFQIYMGISLNPVHIFFMALPEILLISRSFDRHKNFYMGSIEAYRKATLLIILIFMILTPPLYMLSGMTDGILGDKREIVKKNFDNWRYSLPEESMPDGDLTMASAFNPSGDTALEVKMSKPDSIWLRGYIGSSYTGKSWEKEDPSDLYDRSDLFYWLHRDNFFGQKQLADAALATGKEKIGNVNRISIKNRSASSRNIYAPYELQAINGDLMPESYIGDARLNSPGFIGLREYHLNALPNIVKCYPEVMNELYKGGERDLLHIEPFLLVESNYAKYVYDTYTVLPKEVEKWMGEYLGEVLPKGDEISYTSAKQAIISYLTGNTSYATEPKGVSGDDFAHDFLLLNKSGYSVHYATAATLMFRYLGIPARYVEGYIITPDDVAGAKENTIFKIDGTHAHAWVEVYQSGVGWIPVEVTPPYFGLMEEADTLQGISEPEQKPEEPEPNDNIGEEQSDRPEELEEDYAPKSGKGTLALLIAAGILLIIIIFLIYRYKKYKKWLYENLSLCCNDSDKVAVAAMFGLSIKALEKLGQDTKGIWLSGVLAKDFHENTGLDDENMIRALSIYEEAVYSDRAISPDKRGDMEAFTDKVHRLLKERFRGFRYLKVWKLDRLFTKLGEA
jgi:hypothetical protein